MRILFIAAYPPSRIRIRSYGFLNHLKRDHHVTLLVQVSSKQEDADVEALREQGNKVIVIREIRQQAILRSGLALLTSYPLQAAYARSTRLLQTAYELCQQGNFDVVHVEHLRAIASVESLAQHFPLVWDAVDCISLLFQQASVAGPTLSVRALASLEYKRTYHYEAKMLSKLSHIVTISERDRQALLTLSTPSASDVNEVSKVADVHVVSSGVDLEYYHPLQQERRPDNVVFSGKMSYHANVASALYLYHEIMPLIWQQRPNATLTIVGSNPPKSLRQLTHDSRVEVTGYVDDMRPYIARAQVMISPMVYSVGLQNKVLEAMALGTPSIVSQQSAESLSAQHGKDLLIAHSTQEFAESTLLLLKNDELRAYLSYNGRAYVEQEHNWQSMVDRLTSIYQFAIASHAHRLSSTPMDRQAVSNPSFIA